jgi:lincosamide nucleotidyltransferase A/C/D/E
MQENRLQMVSAEEVIRIYKCLGGHGIQTWLTGGWGIDALLGEQTRPHKDLDVVMLLDDVARTCAILEGLGYTFAYLWPENRPANDRQGVETATAFVLQEPDGREIDIHAFLFDEQGNGIPAWAEAEDFFFKKEDLSGKGVIAGSTVQCLTPEMQIRCHLGYAVPEKQLRDLAHLQAKYGVEFPYDQ